MVKISDSENSSTAPTRSTSTRGTPESMASPQIRPFGDLLVSSSMFENSPPQSPATSVDSEPSPLESELAAVIHDNVMQAAADNARSLGLDSDLSTSQSRKLRIRRPMSTIPPSLRPVKLQSTVEHDPILDCLPEWRLRHRVMKAIAQGTVDQEALCADIRSSGTPVDYFGGSERRGLVVWGPPELSESWETSKSFLIRWSSILEGCDEFLASTNAYRTARGEDELSLPGNDLMSPITEVSSQ